jgi:hypothetical protein
MLHEIKAARDFLREDGKAVLQAPFSFVVGCFMFAGVVFVGLEWYFSGQLEIQKDTIENQKQKSAYRCTE